jgi:CheY-like chemotaxis protein
VQIATTGEEGLGLIPELRPDVVLCDRRLPGMTGGEVARGVKGLVAADRVTRKRAFATVKALYASRD